ncbi:hypothetical protein FACS189479_00030 [Spirochaetia bacterium]|nr:hypothetical protein FACS189479_00030 [Spirochaetia bacterium]
MNKQNDTKADYNQEKKVMTNAINRVEIEDLLVFKGKFVADFCPGVNVLIGSNGSGKTTLMKVMYAACQFVSESNKDKPDNNHFTLSDYFTNFYPDTSLVEQIKNRGKIKSSVLRIFNNSINMSAPVLDISSSNDLSALQINLGEDGASSSLTLYQWCRLKPQAVFIPTAEMLSHARGFLALNRERQLPFDKTEIDILSKAELEPTREITSNANRLIELLRTQIGGQVVFDGKEFYVDKDDQSVGKVSYSFEASGIRKIGLLWKLLRNGLLESGSILFWDEPEASINPELIPTLVDILLELQRGGVQIFIATHSYDVARWFELNKKAENLLRYFNLRRTDNGIVADVADDYVSLSNSLIEDAGDMLLRRVTDVAAEKAGVILK